MTGEISNSQARSWLDGLSSGSVDVDLPRVLGIVPEPFRGSHAASLFPAEERVYDTCTISALEGDWRSVRPWVRWMPVQVTCEPG